MLQNPPQVYASVVGDFKGLLTHDGNVNKPDFGAPDAHDLDEGHGAVAA